MPTWDSDVPAQSGYLQSSKVRENLQALGDHNLGVNLLGDPTFMCWPAQHNVTPIKQQGYWLASGDGVIERDTDSGDFQFDGIAPLITSLHETIDLYQDVLTTNADMTPFEARYYSGGIWGKCSEHESLRFYVDDGVGTTYSDYHTGGGAWEWLTVAGHQVTTSTPTRLRAGVKVADLSANVDGATLVAGLIAPPDYLPAPTRIKSLTYQMKGNPVVINTVRRFNLSKPYIVRSAFVRVTSAVTGQDLIVDVDHLDHTPTWQSMFTTGNRLRVTTHIAADYREPDGTYRYRCFNPAADANSGSHTDADVRLIVDQAPGGAGKDPVVQLNALFWMRPYDQFNNFNDP